MTKPELSLGIEVIKYTFDKLPDTAKVRLVEELQRQTWGQRLAAVTQRMRASIRKARVSGREIDRVCTEVKREYDEKHHRH